MERLVLKIELPVYYTIERKNYKTVINKKTNKTRLIKDTTHLIGLNWFRNAFHITQNDVKQCYHKLIEMALKDLEIKNIGKYTTYSKYCFKSSSSDASNVIPIIEKFFLDALQELNIVKDDNVLNHISSKGWEVEQDKNNPRVIIYLYEVLNE